MAYSPVLCGDPGEQWEWHEAYRDQAKNMYRTSYMDASHNREVHVKSDMPSGYGGHIQSLRHDVLHRNTAFDRNNMLARQDPSRDALPSFVDHIAGIPTATQYPQGAKKRPTFGVIPHNGKTTMPRVPWGQQVAYHRDPLNHRFTPPTMTRVQSSPILSSQRMNTAAMNAGALVASGGSAANGSADLSPHPGEDVTPPSMPKVSPTSAQLRRTVTTANETAMRGRMPSESEVLAEQMEGSVRF